MSANPAGHLSQEESQRKGVREPLADEAFVFVSWVASVTETALLSLHQ